MDAVLFEKEFPSLARHLGSGGVTHLLQLADVHELPAGHTLISDMSPMNAIYLIVSGEISVELHVNGKTLLLGRHGKGKWVGEISLFSADHISTADVITITPTTILSLRHEDFIAAKSQHPEFVGALTQVFVSLMTQRLRASSQVLQQIGEHRLAFVGSEALLQSDNEVRQGWLKTMLKKLSGAEE